ncbi:hypothetical protein BGI40_06395 [Snodgrassella communis]|uniref:Uncharacterized protein n=1 Tax=Snodgrassella communis TaxID=2946699 RepID=A0A066TQF2_9NEIS|nr:hypothetical protein [Snodgrassella communis]KDN11704.1 hypothetical protein SALWKB12_1908 [Snodgrassella communis]KDN14278.1 hypothetical protein SALWKB29_1768 [Snodgrassella communis]PIT06654.1 hypothetical protein BGI29_11125 [Snodgrassella communis]PIT25585.1 hypothetical protein BGI38_09600 [Snodgrassella communis]PIT27418.1 hypothetical protein BGI39_08115 [Snodgrassella communis]
MKSLPPMPKWVDDAGNFVSCTEKIKVMQQNMQEIYELAQEAFEDGLLMGCQEQQLRAYLTELMATLENPYQ